MVQPIGWQKFADRMAKIPEITSKKINEPEFCPRDLRLVPGNEMALMTNPTRILVRLVLN